MLNKIWPVFIILSFIYALLKSKMPELNDSIFNSCSQTVEMLLTFLGIMCMWNGIMQIIKETTLIDKIKKLLKPFMKFLFPELNKKSKAYEEMSMNIVANLLGLGNATTPLGLKAMQSLQEENENKETLSNTMIMFLVLNTASIQIIPTTIIAIRSSLGAENPAKIIVPVWISTILAASAGILTVKILSKRKEKK